MNVKKVFVLLGILLSFSLFAEGKKATPEIDKLKALTTAKGKKAYQIALALHDVFNNLETDDKKEPKPFPGYSEKMAATMAVAMAEGDKGKLATLVTIMKTVIAKAGDTKDRSLLIELDGKLDDLIAKFTMSKDKSDDYKDTVIALRVAEDALIAENKTEIEKKAAEYKKDKKTDEKKAEADKKAALLRKVYALLNPEKEKPGPSKDAPGKDDKKVDHVGEKDGPPKKHPEATPDKAWDLWKKDNPDTPKDDYKKWLTGIKKHGTDDDSMNAAHLFISKSKNIDEILKDGNYEKYGLTKEDRDYLQKVLKVKNTEDIDELEKLSQDEDKVTAEAASRELLRRHNSKDKVRRWSQSDFVRTGLNKLNKLEKAMSGKDAKAAAKAMVDTFSPLNKTDLKNIEMKWKTRKGTKDLSAEATTYAQRAHCGAQVIRGIRKNNKALEESDFKEIAKNEACKDQTEFMKALNEEYAPQHTANKNFHKWLADGDKKKIMDAYDRADLEAYRDQRMATALDKTLDEDVRGKAKAEWLALDKMLDGDKYITLDNGKTGKDKKSYTVRAVRNTDPGFNRTLNAADGTIKTESVDKNAPVEIQIMGENDDELFASAARFYERNEKDPYRTRTGTIAFNSGVRSRDQGQKVEAIPDKDLSKYLEALNKAGEKHLTLYSPQSDDKGTPMKARVPVKNGKVTVATPIKPISGIKDEKPKANLELAKKTAITDTSKCAACHKGDKGGRAAFTDLDNLKKRAGKGKAGKDYVNGMFAKAFKEKGIKFTDEEKAALLALFD